MYTKQNNKNFKIDWQYESEALLLLLAEAGIPVEDARKMKRSELRQVLKVDSLPSPTSVRCVITNQTDEEMVSIVTSLNEEKKYSKDDMRKVAMGNSLRGMFPGVDNKGTRKAFFDVYLTRKLNPGLKKFLRLFDKYENQLVQLQNQTDVVNKLETVN